MKRKLLTFAAAFAVALGFALICVTVSQGPRPSNQVVQGKPISQWVKESLASDQSYQFTPVLKSAGPEAVPFLIPALQQRDSSINSNYVKMWPKIPDLLRRHLDQPVLARDARMRAVVDLREMGPAGKDAVPALIERLSDPDHTISLHSAIALGNMGSNALSAVPALQPFLTNKSHTVRVYCAIAVWKITGQPEPSLSILEAGMNDRSAAFRWAAVVFLGEMGPAAQRAIPQLEEGTRDSDKGVASLSIQALAEISPGTVPILTNLLADADPGLRISAAIALGKLGPPARDAVPALVKALEDHSTGAPMLMGHSNIPVKVSDCAVEALKSIDPATAQSLGFQ